MSSLPQKILIVRLGAIGDVVNAQVLANALVDADVRVDIGWAVHGLARPLLEGHPSVRRVHVWARERGWRGFRELVRAVRAERYDLAIDLQRLTKSALLARLSGAPRVLGFDRRRTKELSFLWTRERIAATDPGAHMVEQYLEFARHLGLARPQPRFAFPHDIQAARFAEQRLTGLSRAPVVLHLGATKPANRWLPERFGALAREVMRRFDRPVILTGGPGERSLAERALAALGRDSAVIDLVGATELLELLELLRGSAALVSADSGPMHLGAAVGTPVLALFGAADPRRTGPWGERRQVIATHPPCAPCQARDCRMPRHICMEDLDVESVTEALGELLRRYGA